MRGWHDQRRSYGQPTTRKWEWFKLSKSLGRDDLTQRWYRWWDHQWNIISFGCCIEMGSCLGGTIWWLPHKGNDMSTSRQPTTCQMTCPNNHQSKLIAKHPWLCLFKPPLLMACLHPYALVVIGLTKIQPVHHLYWFHICQKVHPSVLIQPYLLLNSNTAGSPCAKAKESWWPCWFAESVWRERTPPSRSIWTPDSAWRSWVSDARRCHQERR